MQLNYSSDLNAFYFMRSNVINDKFVNIFEEYQFECVIQGLDKSLNKGFGNSESLLKKNAIPKYFHHIHSVEPLV